MVTFEKNGSLLLLTYKPDSRFSASVNWVYQQLNDDGEVPISKVYQFTKAHLHGDSAKIGNDLNEPLEEPVTFVIGTLNGEYYILDSKVLSIDFPLYIHKSIEIKHKLFAAAKNVAIFPIIASLKPKEIHIGGKFSDAITEVEFQRMLKQIPSDYEVRKYVIARVSAIAREFIETQKDGEGEYNLYMNKKISGGEVNLDSFKGGEKLKYAFLLDKLEAMLANEDKYSEGQWQKEILQIILLLYPKYIKVFEHTPVKDSYNNKTRELDFLLVDSTGNVDIVEIKKPFDKCIVTANQYRDNHVPLRELSGAVMQVEKYIFYLNKWGKEGEDKLTQRYKDKLPEHMSIKITNPSGLIIMGRDNNLTAIQKQDFEVIKRKYKNVIDIITYDDLISRLKFTIAQLSMP